MKELERLLTFYEEHLDVDRQKEVEQRHVDALEFNNIDTIPLTVVYPFKSEKFEEIEYFEAYYSYEK